MGTRSYAAVAAMVLLGACQAQNADVTRDGRVRVDLDSLVALQRPVGPDVLDALTAVEKAALREKLCDAGRYECCVEPGCDMCITQDGVCDCYAKIKKGEKICRECYSGYRRGNGRIKTVNLNDLRKIQNG